MHGPRGTVYREISCRVVRDGPRHFVRPFVFIAIKDNKPALVSYR